MQEFENQRYCQTTDCLTAQAANCPFGETINFQTQEIQNLESLLGTGMDELVEPEIAQRKTGLEECLKACPLLAPIEQLISTGITIIEPMPFKDPIYQRSLNGDALISFALGRGFSTQVGRGRHSTKLVSPDGLQRMPVPTHGAKDLAKGTRIGILNWIFENSPK